LIQNGLKPVSDCLGRTEAETELQSCSVFCCVNQILGPTERDQQ